MRKYHATQIWMAPCCSIGSVCASEIEIYPSRLQHKACLRVGIIERLYNSPIQNMSQSANCKIDEDNIYTVGSAIEGSRCSYLPEASTTQHQSWHHGDKQHQNYDKIMVSRKQLDIQEGCYQIYHGWHD